MTAVHLEILKEDSRTSARLGKLHTPHGVIDTPGVHAGWDSRNGKDYDPGGNQRDRGRNYLE